MKRTARAEPDSTRDGATAERTRREAPFGAPHVFVLAVIDGNDPGGVHRIVRRETLIGRGEQAHCRLDDDQVSKRHGLIRVSASVCSILDLDSRNGTLVNGRPLRPGVAHRLRHLDTIQLGGTRLFLLTGRFKPNDAKR